jgi:DNA polymerase III delta subunit
MVIFLYGEDTFRSHQKLLGIKEKYLESDKSGSGLSSFDFDDKANLKEVVSVFSMSNLLAPKRLVIIKRTIAKAPLDTQKELVEYLKKNIENFNNDTDLVILFWEDNAPKKNNALYKFLEKNTKKQNFEKLLGIKINQWILKTLHDHDEKATISKGALEKLVLYLGSETAFLDSEIGKLANYADGKMISEEDVETLVKANVDNNIFATIDALGQNNKKEAMRLLHNNLQNGEDPFYIFSMFIYQFRNMLKISDLRERGMSNEYEISKLTKIHPFVVRKSLAQTRIFTFDRLKKIYKKLGLYDTMVKTGKMEMKMALDKFVAEL